MVVGLLLATWAACGDISYAEPRHLPARTVCTKPGAAVSFELPDERWLQSRSQMDRANATAEANRKLTKRLIDVSQRALRLTEPEPGWKIATRWTAIGVAVGAAFVGGAVLF